MAYTIANLKDDLAGVSHGTNLNDITNLTSLINRAARKVIAEIDPQETIQIANIANAIHDSVYDYTAPTDLKGNKVIDIRPQASRRVSDNFSQTFSEEFDLSKPNNTFEIRHDNAVKTLRLSKAITPAPLTLHAVNGITENGTWAVGDDATNLTKDTVTYVSGSASLNFDVNGSGTTGYLEISDMTDVDLTDHDELSSIFVWVYIPSASAVTNWILRWGNDSSAYWSSTVTSPHDASSFKDGWNLLRFDWNGATETGTVDPSAIDYLRITVTYDGTADTDFRLDNIVSSIGQIYEIEYYSKYIFRNSSGTFIEETSTDTDIVNLDTDSYNILVYECAYLIAQQQQGQDSVFDRNYFKEELYGDGQLKAGLYELYKRSYPSEVQKPQSTYYRMPRKSYFKRN